MSSLSTAIAEFGLDFFKLQLKQNEDKNIIFSPLSIAAALAMVLYGARGETENQMEEVLHFNEAQGARTGDSSATEPKSNVCRLMATGSQCDRPGGIHSQFQALLSQLNKPTKDYDLSIANRLYGKTGNGLVQHYLHCIQELYHGGLESAEFGKATEKTRELINSWVARQTHDKITELFPPGNLDPNAALVLVNAVYFKGKWQSRFKEENTKEEPFWVNKNESKNVPMMIQTGIFNYVSIEDPPLQVLEMPYEGNDLSMFILLPKDTGDDDFGLEKLARSLTHKNLEEWTHSSNMSPREINVHLPRFKVEEEYDLKASLKSMGMTLPFDKEKADLSGISQQRLVVSQATHKSLLEVNEEGTEAAAGSGVVAVPVSDTPPILINFNRPFILNVTDSDLKTIVFMSRISSP